MKKYIISLCFIFLTTLLLTSCHKKVVINYLVEDDEFINASINQEPKMGDNLYEILKDVTVNKKGHEFLGWSLDGETLISTNQKITTKKIDVKPLFAKLKYTITYIIGDEEEVETYEYQEAIVPPTTPVKIGYNFIAWDQEIPSVMPDEDLVITALFDDALFTITYIIDEEETEVVSYKYQETISNFVPPAKTGYTFSGWDQEVPAVMPAKNLTFKAIYRKNTYTITYQVAGVTYLTETYEYGAPIIKPQDPQKEGNTFTGWSNPIPDVMPAKNLIFKAKFTINNYTITYQVEGEEDTIRTYQYGSRIGMFKPFKQGLSFVDWDEKLPETMPARNLVVSAIFEEWKVAKEANGSKLMFIGHAGSYLGIMNSEEAILNGIKVKGYDAIECDIKQTSDGVFVLCHDDTFNGLNLASTNWANLKDVEYTAKRGNVYTTKICTLERYLAICKEYSVYAVIELKSSKGITSTDQSRMAALMEVIEKAGMLDYTILLTSQWECLKWVRENGYDYIPCQYLVNSADSETILNRCIEWNFDVSFNISSTNTKEWIDRYHEAGLKVSSYTYTQYVEAIVLQEWINKGVDFVTCDVLTRNDVTIPDQTSNSTSVLNNLKKQVNIIKKMNKL